MERVGELQLPSRTRFSVVDALARAIVFQQLNGKAAETILGRLLLMLGVRKVTARAIAAVTIEDLRTVGVSNAKARALKDLADHAQARRLPTPDALFEMADAEAIERLTVVRGVGPWTVQMLLMFKVGRHDILPLSDYGIRAGAQLVHELPALPSTAELSRLGVAWSPYRSLASLYLWRALDSARDGRKS